MMHDINARIGEIDSELEQLAALTDPTDEDVARTEALLTEREERIAERQAAIERTNRIAEAYKTAKATGTAGNGGSLQVMKRVEPYTTDLRMLDNREVVDVARAILDRPEARHISADGKAKADSLFGKFQSRLARYAVATSRPEYRSAFAKYVSGREGLLSNDERMAVHEVEELRAAALADATGGYAVPVLLDPTVIYVGDGAANPFRAISRTVTGMDDTWRGVSSAGISVSWDGEAAEVSDDTPTLVQPTVTAYKAQGFVPFSIEIGQDWGSMAEEMSSLFAQAKDEEEAAKFATGTGSSQPVGIVTALVAGSGTVANVTPDTDGALFAADLYDLFAALPPRYRSNASWVMSLSMQNEVRQLGDDKLGNQTVDLRAPYNFQLLGRPVYEASAMASFTGTTGVANLMVVGDFRNFVIFDRIGASVELIPHLFATGNNRPSGQRGLYYHWRVGSDSVNDNGFRLLRNT